MTALMTAIRRNEIDSVFELIVGGANIEYRNKVWGGTVVGESVRGVILGLAFVECRCLLLRTEYASSPSTRARAHPRPKAIMHVRDMYVHMHKNNNNHIQSIMFSLPHIHMYTIVTHVSGRSDTDHVRPSRRQQTRRGDAHQGWRECAL